ncbi:MAG: DUF2249 domain-containing protein [Verrucomicrobiales bacterium]|nr:DUF2249 domain-containing protein [Verrucomicrobiales bacterium]
MSTTSDNAVVDVRTMTPRDRHPTIFRTFDGLPDGGSLLLVNDHDPVPLYYQFAVEYSGGFRWDYLDRGPEVWRVRISRGDFADPGFRPERGAKGSCRPAATPVPIEFVRPLTLDVRRILAEGGSPCGPIEEAVGRLIPGQSLVVLAPFEPVPLYTKLGICGFSHDTTRLEDGTWRVEFKPGTEAVPERFEVCGSHDH